jgi:hypothetical protein
MKEERGHSDSGRRRAAFWACLAAGLLLRCSGAPEAVAGARILFSDDLRVWSVGPGGEQAREFPGKGGQTPFPWKGGILYASYRGPYFFFDPLRPGIYRCDAAGRRRRRLADCPALPLLQGVSRSGLLFLLPDDRTRLHLLGPEGGTQRSLSLPAPARCAAVSPEGDRCAVVLEPRFRTVVLGNQAWFTEGSDALLLSLNDGRMEPLPLPALLAPEGDVPPRLEDYAASGIAAVSWLSGDEILFASAPGLWSKDLRRPGACSLLRPRRSGEAPADGVAVDSSRARLAFTLGGRLLVRDLRSGEERDITPPGLVGGAHHPAWLEAGGTVSRSVGK